MVSKPLNLLLSLLLLSLSVALVTFVIQLSQQLDNQLNKNIAPFDMVVGAKGSPLQLVLSAILHIDNPTGNIKLSEANTLQKHPFVKTAIPVSYGDNYKGYRILGTEASYLDQYNAQLQEGKLVEVSFEVVVGNSAASTLGLHIGDQFTSSHGLAASGVEEHDDHPFTVTGILEPTGTVVDQLLITNLESIWDVHNHKEHNEDEDDHDHEGEHDKHDDHHHHDDESETHDEHNEEDHEDGETHEHEEEHDDHKEITALLIKFKSPLGLVQLPRFINENTTMQAALPGFEIQRLVCLLYTSPSPRDQRGSRMPSSA